MHLPGGRDQWIHRGHPDRKVTPVAFRLLPKLFVLAGALIAVPVLAPSASASGQPGDGPLIHTTCTYDQLFTAIRAEAPTAAAELEQRPAAQQKLRDVVAMSVEQRQQELSRFLGQNPGIRAKLDEKWNAPEGQDKRAVAVRVADTCHNY